MAVEYMDTSHAVTPSHFAIARPGDHFICSYSLWYACDRSLVIFWLPFFFMEAWNIDTFTSVGEVPRTLRKRDSFRGRVDISRVFVLFLCQPTVPLNCLHGTSIEQTIVSSVNSSQEIPTLVVSTLTATTINKYPALNVSQASFSLSLQYCGN